MAVKHSKIHEEIYKRLINMSEYDEGMNAHLGGMATNFNPYKQNSQEWAAWNLGYNDVTEFGDV